MTLQDHVDLLNRFICLLTVKVKAHYVFDYELKKKKDGKEYHHITDAKLAFEPENFRIKLENLFNGNKLLGT